MKKRLPMLLLLLSISFFIGCDDPTVDKCPEDPEKTEPGVCGCGIPEGTCSDGEFTLEIRNGSGNGHYNAGTKITIKANAPIQGKTFNRWKIIDGNPTIANMGKSTTTLTMPSNNATLKATYKTVSNDSDNDPLVDGQYVPLDAPDFKPDCWGVYTRGKNAGIDHQTAPNVIGLGIKINWSDVEPQKGKFNFEKVLGKELKKAEENNFYVTLKIMVASPNGRPTPKWLYTDVGVPKVLTYRGETPTGEAEGILTYPYYLDSKYIERYYSLIEAFGNYVDGLADHLHQRILFTQITEGSTGDGQPYKGSVIDGYEKYEITKTQWSKFRMDAWDVYKKHFIDVATRKVPLLVNSDANKKNEEEWMLKNLEYMGYKDGMFTHGWHISGGIERRAESMALTKQAEISGKRTFIRGEQDQEMFVYGWSTNNIPRALYTSALYCLYNGVDLWDIPSDALIDSNNQQAFKFFNKYAGRKNPRMAPAAFCALREGLDASDTKKFPENTYGPARKDNIDRYLKIAKAYSSHGAMQGDPEKATGGGMVNRKRSDYNDVGWGIIPGNYYRFLEQIKPETTSKGWWHQGPEKSIFSQFGRSFKIRNGKGEMLFKLHPYFFEDNVQPGEIEIRIVYLDRGKGKWSLKYSSPGKPSTAFSVQNKGTGKWIEHTHKITDFVSGGKLEEADFIVKYDGGSDTIFHMIEINIE